jgi:hypothetical protein
VACVLAALFRLIDMGYEYAERLAASGGLEHLEAFRCAARQEGHAEAKGVEGCEEPGCLPAPVEHTRPMEAAQAGLGVQVGV